MNALSWMVKKLVPWSTAAIGLFCYWPHADAGVMLLHTFESSQGHEVTPAIAVSNTKLAPLLPGGYSPVPASAFGVGGPDQGIVALVNYQGFGQSMDNGQPYDLVALDLAVLVAPPPAAMQAGLNIPGAFHFYTLAIYTNVAEYAATLQGAGMPGELVNSIDYDRQIDDGTGVGSLTVTMSPDNAPFKTVASSALGYSLQPGAVDAIFWYEGANGTTALHVHDEPFRQGDAFASVYVQPQSPWEDLLTGGGLAPCAPDNGYSCVIAPALNFSWDGGTDGELLLITAAPEPASLALLSIGFVLLVGAKSRIPNRR